MPDAVRLQGLGVLASLAARRREGTGKIADILVSQQVEHARHGLGVLQAEAGDVAPCDGAGHQEGMGGVLDRLVKGIARLARHLGAPVDAGGGLAQSGLAEPGAGVVGHAQTSMALACIRARTRVRRPSSGLSSLPPWVTADPNAARAAS